LNQQSCPLEEKVLRSIHSGQWSDQAREHAQRCTACAEVILVSSRLVALAENAKQVAPTVDYHATWLKGKFAREIAQAAKLDMLALVGAMAVAIGGIVGMVVRYGEDAFIEMMSSYVSLLHKIPGGISAQWPLIVIVGGAAMLWSLINGFITAED
jgi:hypothetical protein